MEGENVYFYWWSECSSKCESKLYECNIVFFYQSDFENVFHQIAVLKYSVSDCFCQFHGYFNPEVTFFCSRYFMLLFICSFLLYFKEVFFTLFIHLTFVLMKDNLNKSHPAKVFIKHILNICKWF